MASPTIDYQPYDDDTQLARYIDRYPLSFKRTPLTPLIQRPLTLSERTGPNGTDLFNIGPLDLSKTAEGAPRANGQLIQISGRITDEDGSPLAGATIEIWQANSAGKYIHDADRHNAPVDPHFTGEGRLVTDAEGKFQFFSIKPGAYPVLESGWWWRPPHIHFSILGRSWMDRFVTQIFFPGEPLNETDLLLNAVPDRERPRAAHLPVRGDVHGRGQRHGLPPRLRDARPSPNSGDGLMPVSPYCTIGPFFPASFVEGCEDLTHHRGLVAQGTHITLSGQILQEGGVPTRNTILEIWQPDASGIFRHSSDPRCSQADPGFAGWGRARTDAEGWYKIRTVLPGSYEGRCPHANLMILAIGLTRRLVTTVFFAEDPDSVRDPVLDCVADTAARRRLFAKRENPGEYRFDLILRGENETPFFLD